MANIQMSYYNGSSYVDLYPKTTVSNLTDLSGSTNILSSSTKSTLGLASNAVPDNAFSTLASMVNSRAKIATGSYVGTGTYGASNPCSLTFDFNPWYIAIGCMSYNYSSFAQSQFLLMIPLLDYYNANSTSSSTKKMCPFCFTREGGSASYRYDYIPDTEYYPSSKTIKWYNSSYPIAQLNTTNNLYYYIVLGV